MPAPREPRRGPHTATGAAEQELVFEASLFMQVVARVLFALREASRGLRRQLEGTKRYQRVAGHDGAEREHAFDQAGTLGAMLEFDLQHAAAYLEECARRTGARGPLRDGRGGGEQQRSSDSGAGVRRRGLPRTARRAARRRSG